MWQGTAGVVLAAIATAGGGVVSAQSELPAVRPESAAIRALIASGMDRSATFRDLKTRLDSTDVIVYVRFLALPFPGHPGLSGLDYGRFQIPAAFLIRMDRLRQLTGRLDGVAGARAPTRQRGGGRADIRTWPRFKSHSPHAAGTTVPGSRRSRRRTLQGRWPRN